MTKPDESQNAEKDQQQSEDATSTQSDASSNDNNASQDAQPTSVEYVTMDAFNEMKSTLESFRDTMNTIMGGIKSIKDAQGVMVRAGMVVQDDSEPEPIDDFKPLSELDFSVKR